MKNDKLNDKLEEIRQMMSASYSGKNTERRVNLHTAICYLDNLMIKINGGKKLNIIKDTLPIDIIKLSFAEFVKIHNWINENDYVFYSGKSSSFWETNDGLYICDTTKELINMFNQLNN